MNPIRVIVSSLFVAACLGAASCRPKPAPEPSRPPAPASAHAAQPLDRTTLPDDGRRLGIGRVVRFPALECLDGTVRSAADLMKDQRAVVVTMTSVGCPLSRKYAPRLASLEAEYARHGVRFVYVNAVAAETRAELRDHARLQGFHGPYVPDASGSFAALLGARTTTEIFVFDASWRLRYRGAFDDQFGVGIAREAPTRSYLREAIDAVLDGREVVTAATSAPGCLIDHPTPSPSGTHLTYHGRIERILNESCVPCHIPGGQAPFALNAARLLEGRASMMAAVVRDGLMPPSHGEVSANIAWVGAPSLGAAEREELLAFLASDRPVGDPADAPPPVPDPSGWELGRPDRLLMTPRFRLPGDGPMVHRRFAVPVPAGESWWVRSIELKPTKVDSVHHALVWLMDDDAVVPPDTEVPEGQVIAAYSPGFGRVEYPSGVARRIVAGSVLVVDVYARPMGRDSQSDLRMSFRLSPVPPSVSLTTRMIRTDLSTIGPGGTARSSGRIEFPDGGAILGVTPYMRLRGREATIKAVGADGAPSVLLGMPRFDPRWFYTLRPADPIVLSPGSALVLECRHDNSALNINNPDPGAALSCGMGITQDIGLAAIDVVVTDE